MSEDALNKRLITNAVLIAALGKILKEFNTGLQAAVGMQIQPAITRRMVGEGKISAVFFKLNTA